MHKKITGKIAARKKILQGQPAAVDQNTDSGNVKKDLKQQPTESARQSFDFGVQRFGPDGSEPVFKPFIAGQRIFHSADRAVKAALDQRSGNFRPMLQDHNSIIAEGRCGLLVVFRVGDGGLRFARAP